MINVLMFFALLVVGLAVGWWLGARLARAQQTLDRLIRDDAVCRECERGERGLYARWLL